MQPAPGERSPRKPSPSVTRSHPPARGAAAKGLPDDEIPQALREQTKYRIVRKLGGGGMGSIYEAHHNFMHRPVVIKIVNAALVQHPEALRRFYQEMEAVGQVDHPNIARALDADKIGELQLLVLELVPGQNLQEFLTKRGRLSVADACRCVRQACVGLQHAHERGLVHRDLKPHNLMLTPDGKIKILDFGLAKIASEQRTATGLTREKSMMGTPDYLAPEQALDAATADIRADIYSLGCVLYCLLTGAPPFAGGTEVQVILAHQHDMPQPLTELRGDVPQELSDLIDRMLAKNPDDRPQTPREVAQRCCLLPKGKSPRRQCPMVAATRSGRRRSHKLRHVAQSRHLRRRNPNRATDDAGRVGSGQSAEPPRRFSFSV